MSGNDIAFNNVTFEEVIDALVDKAVVNDMNDMADNIFANPPRADLTHFMALILAVVGHFHPRFVPEMYLDMAVQYVNSERDEPLSF